MSRFGRIFSHHNIECMSPLLKVRISCLKQYECLVEGCGVKLKCYKSRQQHLVDKHKFPRSFEFYRKAQPSKHQRQKYHRKKAAYRREETKATHMDIDRKTLKQPCQQYQPKQAGPEETRETNMEVEEKIDDLASAVSKLSTSDSTPSCISFGHRHARGFAFVPRSIRQNGKQQSDAKR